MRISAIGQVLALGILAAGTAQAQSPFEAKITRTTHNIPHIEADSWEGVGYGVAYAYAQDNICMLAEEFATVRGDRSVHFGPENETVLGFDTVENLISDVFYRSQIDIDALRRAAQSQSAETNALMMGYVAGYNRFLFDNPPDTLPEACRGKEWVRTITSDDLLRLTEKTMLLASSLPLAAGIVAAEPPGGGQAAAAPGARLPQPGDDEPRYGSNGWAFGGDVTANGRGLVIGNPHFPWEGPARFWQMHVRGPDGYDVMGVGIAGTPIPTLGFNKDVAWTHTVTAARHFTLYALQLVPGDPTSYLVDGEPRAMEEIFVSVPMPGDEPPFEAVLYTTDFGPVVSVAGSPLQWGDTMAFAMLEANSGNQRAMDAWLGIGRATSVSEIEAAVSETMGIPWVNTIAADRAGNALHADITVVPNVTAEFAQSCGTPFSGLVAAQVTLLDGSRSECDWRRNPTAAPYPGLLPPADQASRTRRDYVTNSNDSYWLSHAGEPYRQLSPILGAHKTELSLRTRSNFTETEATLAAAKMDHEQARELVFGNKVLAADMSVDAVLALCEGSNSAAEACAALAGWDREVETGSEGAYLFLTFWDKVRRNPALWAVPFDPADPVATPNTLRTDGEAGPKLLAALAEAAVELTEAGIALDAKWGEVQFRRHGEERIAVHGGPGTAGILNMQRSREIEGGLTPVHGSSYIQIVGFDEEGPVADAILSYSQSTDPASPFYSDQTRLYAVKDWYRLPFSDEAIAAAKIGETLILSE
jgi:acyl-homoserine-lactone acylase